MGLLRLHPLAQCELAGRPSRFLETLVQRDARNLTRIRSLDALPRLLTLAAGQSARLLNVTELASPFQLSRPTIHDYVTLLERMFLIEPLPPWHVNRLSRLVKTPKLHVGDTGVACALLGLDPAALAKDRATLGQLLETFVLQELRRHASWHDDEIRFHHFRGLRKLKDAAGRRFVAGVVLYDGEASAPFGEGFFAVPIRAVWELR